MSELPEVVDRWVGGWLNSRGHRVTHTMRFPEIQVFDAHRDTELVIAEPDDATLQAAMAQISGRPRSMLTVLGRTGITAAEGTRVVRDDELVMAVDLAPVESSDHDLDVEIDSGEVNHVIHLVRAGRVIGNGQIGIVGRDAVFDKIETDQAWRGRGLARWLMARLTDEALRRGATTGLLAASDMGQGLYRRLGWRDVTTMVSVQGVG